MKPALRALGLVMALAALAGCGFQLRGFGQGGHIGSVEVKTARVVTFATTLTRVLRQSGVDVVGEGERARYLLEVLDQREERRTLSVTELARTAEYELLIDVSYRAMDAKGELRVPDRVVSGRRIFRVDRDNLAASSQEEALLRDEILADLSLQMMRSLDASARQSR